MSLGLEARPRLLGGGGFGVAVLCGLRMCWGDVCGGPSFLERGGFSRLGVSTRSLARS